MTRKPFTYSDRLAIETMLNEGNRVKDISDDIKNPSSGIVKEIQKHMIFTYPSTFNNQHPCLKYKECNVKSNECYTHCKNAEYKPCPKLANSPYVCNGCTTKSGCRFVKKYYKAREAHDAYKELLSNSRIGLHYSDNQMIILIERLCPSIIRSKSVYHAVITINKVFNTAFNMNTIYKEIERNQLPIKSSDLPRCRKQRKRDNKDKSYKRNIEGHTYEDYEKYKKEHDNAYEMQMDTVEGIKENDAPVILTLEIVEINFLFMFKISSQTIEKVVEQLLCFKSIIGDDTFVKLTEILLTDNGKEFNNIDKIMSVCSTINLYFCHPYSSYEKGSIENNHELIRRVIPKGVSLKPYSQKELNLLCSHINSLYRDSLEGKCPFDLIENYISLDKIQSLGLNKINPIDVCLIPELLGDKNINNIKKYLDQNDIENANISFININ